MLFFRPGNSLAPLIRAVFGLLLQQGAALYGQILPPSETSALHHCCSCSPQQSMRHPTRRGIRPQHSVHYRGPTRRCSCPQKLTKSTTNRNCTPTAALHKRGHQQAALKSRIAARHRCKHPVPEQGSHAGSTGQGPAVCCGNAGPPLTVALVSMGMGGGICMVGGRGVLEGLTLLT